LPTRTHLAEITRAFNREYFYTPVVVIFKYSDNEKEYISFANSERIKFKQEWREGEKAGKVSILRDIEIGNTHTGHLKILRDLKISTTGDNSVYNFKTLYNHWQTVFSVSLLSKKFYKELSNWFFWAVENVSFPNELTTFNSEKRVEHNSKNVIRLLTRLLFVWFIKEKKLIPEELFDLKKLQDNILNEISPFHDEESLFKDDNKNSIYYKTILQNLFFASLNCPIKKDGSDSRERGFRGEESYGKHRGVDFLMRHKKYFKNPDLFLETINSTVPFLNGGLFECLDDKEQKIYIDGFSDNMSKTDGKIDRLIVPDYLFFGRDKNIDLSDIIGVDSSENRNANVKGLINILKDYKFTIAENTPIEEDVALDPELLGKVFENLLATYNPETKSTARKQTGSFYTPREIVNYMVDESLIAHLKRDLESSFTDKNELNKKLYQLFDFGNIQPFEDKSIKNIIIKSLDSCKILDPACGSGAYPMGILQKMVFILGKIDFDNELWGEYQLKKIDDELKKSKNSEEKKELEEAKDDIIEAFDDNEADYPRKLYLIENSIYGVDIQPVATQISKLRFFISLVVDQKIDRRKTNFGVRPLPNLETKFVTANTLINIEKKRTLFDTEEIEKLEIKLKKIRHKLFGVKKPETKRKYKIIDKEIRDEIEQKLVAQGLDSISAKKLSEFDPYNQNSSAPFYNSEWMFDIKDGFDIVIGNPPYVQIQKFSGQQCQKDWQNENYETFARTGDIYSLFYERGWQLLKDNGFLCYITSNKWMRANYGKVTRIFFAEKTNPIKLIDFGGYKVFESATVDTNILLFEKADNRNDLEAVSIKKDFRKNSDIPNYVNENSINIDNLSEDSWIISSKAEYEIKKRIEEIGTPLKEWDISINYGIKTGFNEAFIISGEKKDELIAEDLKSAEIIKPILRGRDIKRYKAEFADLWLINSHNGYKKGDGRVDAIDINCYPAVKEHLDQYWEKIERRSDQGKTPYNLRNCAYIENFEEEKIIYPETTQGACFFKERQHFFIDKTGFILIGNNLSFVVSLLSSNLVLSYYKKYCGGVILGKKGFQFNKHAIVKLPIPQISKEKQQPFEILVDMIIFAKENDMDMEASTFESVIDGMVYDLYFEEEMKKAYCYITDRITEVLKPFRDDDTDEFKREYIEKFHNFCNNDKEVFHGLIHRRNIKVVEIINGEGK